MAILMELRCESCGGERKRYHSDHNADYQTLALENAKSVSEALAFLKRKALGDGWVFRIGGFHCPICAELKSGSSVDDQQIQGRF